MTTPRDAIAGLIDRLLKGAHDTVSWHELCAEAATQLDSLLKERDALRSEINDWANEVSRYKAYAEKFEQENGILRDMLLNPDPDIEPDNLRLHREKCDAIDRALVAEQERDALQARVKELEGTALAKENASLKTWIDLHRGDTMSLSNEVDQFREAAQDAESRATRLQQERDEAYERAEDTIRSWTNYSKMQLHAGEMTAQEKRTTEAILNAVARQVRRLSAGPEKEGK